MSDLFNQYPKMSEYFQTSDGQKFFKEDTAKLHAKSLEDKNIKKVERPSKSKATVQDETKTETAKDIVAKSAEMDLATAQDYLATEEALEAPRKTVVEALQKRIAELQNPE